MKVLFMGTPEFSVPALKAIKMNFDLVAVYTQPDKPVGRGLEVTQSPVKVQALRWNLPVHTPEKVSLAEEVEKLKAYKADVAVVVAYGQILKPAVIEAFRYGCVNIHASLLPRWRGAAPIQWSILAGDSETGITTMNIVPKLDAGDMYLQKSIPIMEHDTAKTIHDQLSRLGADLIVETLNAIEEGSIRAKPQDENKVTYAHKLTKEMERLDWTKSSREASQAIRALNPWPGTRVMTLDGLKIKILEAEASRVDGTHGQIYSEEGALILGCGFGVLKIKTLQEDGKRAINSADFINGLHGRGIGLPLQLKTPQEWPHEN